MERAGAHFALGNALQCHDYQQAVQLTEESLVLFSELGLRWEMGCAREILATKYARPSYDRRMREHYQEPYRLFVGDS